MTTATATVTLRLHRDTFPRTDHGFTWVDCYWFECDGDRVSPICPNGGGCERLDHLPGPQVQSALTDDIRHYAPEGYRVDSTKEEHEGFYHVGNVCIVRAD